MMSAAAMAIAARTSEVPAPRWVVTGHVLHASRRWALVWGFVFGIWVVSSVKVFMVSFPTLRDRVQITQSLNSFALFMGLPHHPETVAGFTQWRVLLVAAVIGAIWGLLTSTGLLRGEEDADRWELLLAGPTTRRRATVEALAGLAGALGLMFAATFGLTLAIAQTPGTHFGFVGSLLFAFALVSGAAMFLAVGALASQLLPNRSQAALATAGVLGVAFLLRMVADSQSSLGWMRWISPLGWLEELRPLRDSQPIALFPIFGLIVACLGATVWLAGRRDVNSSVFSPAERSTSPETRLSGPVTLALRTSRTSVLTWLVLFGLIGLMYGSVTRTASNMLSSSPVVSAALGRIGLRHAAESYIGVVFFMVAAVIALFAASQLAAIRDEEASGRLDNLLVQPVARAAWLGSRLALTFVFLLLAGALTGFTTWMGLAGQHTGLSPLVMLEAGMNATLPGIAVLAIGSLAIGWMPQLTATLTYGAVAWSFLVNMLGALIKGSDWLRNASLFAHIAPVPAADPDLGKAITLVALSLAAVTIGTLRFRTRDLAYA